jgi:glycosyltransferase involved in cell wall biosynthesis
MANIRQSKQAKKSAAPMLSVIVPVYNSTNYLKKCLAALAESEFDNYEVLVVDDGSTEPIEPIVQHYGFGYMRIDGPKGPARARNLGVTQVKGQYVAFIDADVCVHQDTLARFAEAFAADPTIDALVGSYDEAPAEASFLSQYKNLFHHYVHQSCNGEISTFWSGCGAIRRDLFLDFGGFDEKRYRRPAIEDIELGTWISAAGYRILLDKNIKAKHLKRWTLWGLVKTDIFDRGIPWTRLMLRAGSLANTLNIKPTQRISVALVYLSVVSALLAFFWPPVWAITALLGLTVTISNMDFYRFFKKHSGIWFTIRVVPLHWLYFLYCGISVIWGTTLHYVTSASTAASRSLETDLGAK